MSKYVLDYDKLDATLSKKAYRLSDVQNRLETVAFDIVRFKDSDESSKLWQIQSADDGEYIVTMYDEDLEKKTAGAWEVALSKTANILQVYYKGDPIVKVATSKLGIPEAELTNVERYLPAKLASNKKLVQALLAELNEPTKKLVFNKYPELI
jgi:ribosomal protein L10